MTEDLILKTLTGLMMEQRTMTQSHQAVAHKVNTMNGAMNTLSETVRLLSETVKALSDSMTELGETTLELTESSERQEQRFGELLEVMTQFSATSTDTRKRVAALEREVEKLKNAS